jgi:hypothetical protein
MMKLMLSIDVSWSLDNSPWLGSFALFLVFPSLHSNTETENNGISYHSLPDFSIYKYCACINIHLSLKGQYNSQLLCAFVLKF